VPFNKTVALKFLDYYSTRMQFQSTLAHLKQPPSTYKQSSIDVVGEFDKIKQKATIGNFSGQYDFEATVQKVIYAMHDGHVDLSAGILSLFSFGSPFFVSSLSKDGKAAPQPYLTVDVLSSQDEGWTPSPISSINGQNATDYLLKFAALNAVGNVESHADWNQLMSSPAQDIQGDTNLFSSGGTFYPGHELNFTLANGSRIDTYWTASFDYSGYVPDIRTPLEFFNFFVLGIEPATSSQPQMPDNSTASTPSDTTPDGDDDDDDGDDDDDDDDEISIAAYIMRGMTRDLSLDSQRTDFQPPKAARSWYDDSFGAYPDNPDIYQPDLGIIGGGILTAYFFEDISTGVLSIPSFQVFNEDIRTFAETVGDFIGNGTAKKINRVVIDLQQNTGGALLLALTTFKQFFPQIDPFAGSRRRSQSVGNILGNTMTHWWDHLDRNNVNHTSWIRRFAANEWVISNRLNPDTGKNFSSWQEYAGPRTFQNDNFTLIVSHTIAGFIKAVLTRLKGTI